MSKQAPTSGYRRSLSNPPCTAVAGCSDPAFVLSYKLPNGKLVRICVKHYNRVKRTGVLGAAASKKGLAIDKRENRKALDSFVDLCSLLGTRWRLVSYGRGSQEINAVGAFKGSLEIRPTSFVHAIVRRGWVHLGPWTKVGSRLARVSKLGHKVLREAALERSA